MQNDQSPSPKKIPPVFWIVGGFGVVLLMVLVCGGAISIVTRRNRGENPVAGGKQIEPGVGNPVASLTAGQLYMAYEENEAKADADFLDKTVEVTEDDFADRETLRKDNGRYVYDFRSNCKKDWLLADPRCAVAVVFRDSEAANLGRWRARSGMTIRGTCKGRIVRDPSYGGKYVAVVDAILMPQ